MRTIAVSDKDMPVKDMPVKDTPEVKHTGSGEEAEKSEEDGEKEEEEAAEVEGYQDEGGEGEGGGGGGGGEVGVGGGGEKESKRRKRRRRKGVVSSGCPTPKPSPKLKAEGGGNLLTPSPGVNGQCEDRWNFQGTETKAQKNRKKKRKVISRRKAQQVSKANSAASQSPEAGEDESEVETVNDLSPPLSESRRVETDQESNTSKIRELLENGGSRDPEVRHACLFSLYDPRIFLPVSCVCCRAAPRPLTPPSLLLSLSGL